MTACSGGFGAGGDDKSGGSDSGKTADPALVGELVLPADQFPEGYQVQEIPKGPEMQEMMDQVIGAVKDATYTPSKCAQVSAVPDSFDLSKIGMSLGMKGTDTAAVAVMPQTTDLDEQRKAVEGDCENVSVEINSGMAAGVKGDVTQKEVSAPKTDADDAVVIDQTTEMTAGGQDVQTSGRLGMAEVNGYTVSVQMQSQQGGPIDDDAFDELFTAAVNRVAEQTS